MNENGIPGVLLIFTVNARSLNPKLQQILHFFKLPNIASAETMCNTPY